MDRKLDVRKIYESVKEKITFKPEAALVLGSGLGNFAEKVEIAEILDYKDIPGFPVSTVPGHKGRFIFGYVEDVPMVIMQGRVHFYEGYSMDEVTAADPFNEAHGREAVIPHQCIGRREHWLSGWGFYADERSYQQLYPVSAHRAQ